MRGAPAGQALRADVAALVALDLRAVLVQQRRQDELTLAVPGVRPLRTRGASARLGARTGLGCRLLRAEHAGAGRAGPQVRSAEAVSLKVQGMGSACGMYARRPVARHARRGAPSSST
jgi:hypothetical protein